MAKTPGTMAKMAVSFGMVTVPVRVMKATDDDRASVAMRSLCPCHKQPIKQKSTCQTSGDAILYGELLHGYEMGKGSFIELTDADLDNLPLRTTRAIDIETFVDPATIPMDVYHVGTYYLQPEDLGVKAFALLRSAMLTTGKIGIAKVSLGKRERICAIRPYALGLLLTTLQWPEDVRSAEGLWQLAELTEKEVALATTLVTALSGDFEPEQLTDGYRDAFHAMLAHKVSGVPLPVSEETEVTAIPDLMADLLKSVEQAQKRKAA